MGYTEIPKQRAYPIIMIALRNRRKKKSKWRNFCRKACAVMDSTCYLGHFQDHQHLKLRTAAALKVSKVFVGPWWLKRPLTDIFGYLWQSQNEPASVFRHFCGLWRQPHNNLRRHDERESNGGCIGVGTAQK